MTRPVKQSRLPRNWIRREGAEDEASSSSAEDLDFEKPIRKMEWTRVMTLDQMAMGKVATYKIDADVQNDASIHQIRKSMNQGKPELLFDPEVYKGR